MLDRLEEAWTRVRSVMVQMPTGTGKTVLLAETIRKEMRNEKGERRNVLVVAHRRELIEQIKETLTQFIGDSVQFITVESIQKLTKANHNYPLSTINYQLIIIDEAHHAVAKTYRELWERWPEARFLGLTATPCRMNDTGFQDLFQVLIQSYTIREFIKAGWLSDFEYVTAEPDNPILRQVAGLTKRGADGDYQTKEMALVMDCEESIAHLYRSYRKFVDGKKGIVYAINQEHAQHITAYYREQGV
ncbi:MAG: DEAD/DEAH box helicase family protein, partial [Prevotella sp.]|nr:DEAD/DEAH box helicase family protein [Prevotella sp.]